MVFISLDSISVPISTPTPCSPINTQSSLLPPNFSMLFLLPRMPHPPPTSTKKFFSYCSVSYSKKAMAPHSSTLAWKIPWTEEPGRLQSMGSRRVGLSDFTFTFHFHALEEEMATHSSVLAWRIPGMGEPGGLPSMGLHRVGHDWSDLAAVLVTHFNVNHVWLFSTLWTVACQAPLFMGFSRPEYWNGLPFPFPGDLPDPRI